MLQQSPQQCVVVAHQRPCFAVMCCVVLWCVAQEYNYHLGAVNTVTFIDDARRFVSSSDDKSLRVWEFGIPVQIK